MLMNIMPILCPTRIGGHTPQHCSVSAQAAKCRQASSSSNCRRQFVGKCRRRAELLAHSSRGRGESADYHKLAPALAFAQSAGRTLTGQPPSRSVDVSCIADAPR